MISASARFYRCASSVLDSSAPWCARALGLAFLLAPACKIPDPFEPFPMTRPDYEVAPGFRLTPSDAFFSIIAPDEVYSTTFKTEQDELDVYVLPREPNVAATIFVSPPIAEVRQDDDRANLYHLSFPDPKQLLQIDLLTLTVLPADAAGNLDAIRERGQLLIKEISVLHPDPGDEEEAALLQALLDPESLKNQKIQILGSPVRIRDIDGNASFDVVYHAPLDGKKIQDVIEIVVGPADLAESAVLAEVEEGDVSLRITIPLKDLAQHEKVQIDAFERTSSEAKTPLERIREGSYARRTFAVIDDRELQVRLMLLDEISSQRLFGSYFTRQFFAVYVHISNVSEHPLIVFGSSVEAEVVMNAQSWDPWYAVYRPLSFQSILECMQDIRRESRNQRIVDLLEFTGQIASAATVFVTHSDYAEGVALFTGTFNPAARDLLLEDILANLSTLQNLAFDEVEEVSPRGQITKYLFLPKGPIYGAVGDEPAYIQEVLPGPSRIAGFRVLESEPVSVQAPEAATEQ